MTTNDVADARAHARAMIENALVSPEGKGGLGAAFDQPETRLRQGYARSLTENDRDDIRAYVNARVDQLHETLIRTTTLDRVWSEPNTNGE